MRHLLALVPLFALVTCTTAPNVKPLAETAPPTVDHANPPAVDMPAAFVTPATPVEVPVDVAPLNVAPVSEVELLVTEAKPTRVEATRTRERVDDSTLVAHKKALATLSGGPVKVTTKDTWRHRTDASTASAGVARSGSAHLGLSGASMGDAGGAGGLGVRGTGAGGGGSGRGIGGLGTVGHGAAGSAAAPPVSMRKVVIDFSDDSITGELTKPEGSYEGSYVKSRKHLSEGAADLVEARLGKREAHDAPAPASPLKAGSTDDNADFSAFLQFLAERTSTSVPAGAMKIDVAGRRFVKVIDADGRPFPAAEVIVRDWKTEKILATAKTYGDGKAPFYASTAQGAAHKWLVEANDGARAVTATWSESDGSEVVLRMPRTAIEEDEVPLDVLFLIDTTGSMGDEIDRIKDTLLSMTAKVKKAEGRAVSLRYGAVLYRDVGDAYVTATRDFTSDVVAFEKSLRAVDAGGGGDTPESLNQGLAEAMVGVQWRGDAAKVAFLVADAVPHMDYADDIPYGESLKDAVTLGVRIHAVAASGLADDDAGSLVFRQIAQYARGRFIFIEYGHSIAASAREHGVDPSNLASNNLDDILFREIRREIDGWGA